MLGWGLAQLGEHLLCKQGVVGSIPSSSTKMHHRACDVDFKSELSDLSVARSRSGLLSQEAVVL